MGQVGTIGFIGLGVMGSRMVQRLLHAGYEVAVFNRNYSKMEPLLAQGASAAADVASLAEQSDMICTCLSMPQDVYDVYLGDGGILKHSRSGTICIDFTTVGMDTSQKIAQLAQERRITYLDAPVSGGPEGVEQGTLTIMVGGDEVAYAKVLPILEVLGSNVHHLGDSGMGSVAKLMNQYLVAVHSLAASEAMVTGTALGLKSEHLYQILRTSYGDSRMLQRHMENFVLPRNFAPGGAVKYVLKDVKLALDLFQEAGVAGRTGISAVEAFTEAVEQGYADKDMSAVIRPLEEKAKTIVRKAD